MRKVYVILTALFLSASSLSAQNVTSKEFNDIKRSKQYFYYDITMDKEEEARNAANVNLAKLINDYCVENSITNVKVNDNDLKNVQYLQMNKNGMVRILAYVEKAIYIGKSEGAETQMPVKSNQVTDKKTKSEIVAVVKVESAKQDSTNKQVKIQEVNIPSRNIPSPEAAALVKNEAVTSLVKWQQDVLEELCHISSAEKLMMRLSELQSQYKVKRFGLKTECRNEKDCFWVVYDSSKNVVAILGPGTSERYNFYKGVNDDLEKYWSQGLNAIWFQLSK